MILRAYFIDSYIFTFIDDRFFMAADFQIPYPNRDIEVLLSNLSIKTFSLRALKTDETPDEIRLPSQFYKRMKEMYGELK